MYYIMQSTEMSLYLRISNFQKKIVVTLSSYWQRFLRSSGISIRRNFRKHRLLIRTKIISRTYNIKFLKMIQSLLTFDPERNFYDPRKYD